MQTRTHKHISTFPNADTVLQRSLLSQSQTGAGGFVVWRKKTEKMRAKKTTKCCTEADQLFSFLPFGFQFDSKPHHCSQRRTARTVVVNWADSKSSTIFLTPVSWDPPVSACVRSEWFPQLEIIYITIYTHREIPPHQPQWEQGLLWWQSTPSSWLWSLWILMTVVVWKYNQLYCWEWVGMLLYGESELWQ